MFRFRGGLATYPKFRGFREGYSRKMGADLKPKYTYKYIYYIIKSRLYVIFSL